MTEERKESEKEPEKEDAEDSDEEREERDEGEESDESEESDEDAEQPAADAAPRSRRLKLWLLVGAAIVVAMILFMRREPATGAAAGSVVNADITLVTSDKNDVDCMGPKGLERLPLRVHGREDAVPGRGEAQAAAVLHGRPPALPGAGAVPAASHRPACSVGAAEQAARSAEALHRALSPEAPRGDRQRALSLAADRGVVTAGQGPDRRTLGLQDRRLTFGRPHPASASRAASTVRSMSSVLCARLRKAASSWAGGQ